MYDFDNNNLYDYYTENQKKKKKKIYNWNK